MSYTNEIKDSLCKIKDKKRCCRKSFLSGIFLDCAYKKPKAENFIFLTENINIIKKADEVYYSLCKKNIVYIEKRSGKKIYACAGNKKELFNGVAEIEAISESFECENCKNSFFRGLFISCGTIFNPDSEYHLELCFGSADIVFYVKNLIFDNIKFKNIKRKTKSVLYLKTSERIEDFLYYINASKISFEFSEMKIIKELRNNLNRVTNFENANFDRLSIASAKQIEAIKTIITHNKFESLPQDLKETAILRLENIGLSLEEIAEISNPKLSKSGINHRIRRLITFAKSIDK